MYHVWKSCQRIIPNVSNDISVSIKLRCSPKFDGEVHSLAISNLLFPRYI